MTADTGETSTYLLGHADDEVQRLLLQGKLYNIYTDSALRVAGLQPGMSVLDVGCGPGDTSLSAARLVGPTGTVVGVDANPEILELARRRAAESGMSTVSFEQATIPDISIDGPFDAVIGRLILMHLPEPAKALRHLATLVRPGGLIAFQEFDISMGRSVPELPRFTMLVDLIVRTCHGAGLSTEFGTSLYGLFQEAGLPAPSMTLGAAMGGAANFADGFKYLVDVWRMLLPVADQLGLVTDEVSDPDALLTCIRDEATSNNAVITGPSLVSAWTTVTMSRDDSFMSFAKRLYGRLTGLDSIPRLPVAEGDTTGSVPGEGELIRLLILGESTAAGVGASTLDEALPGCLARSLGGLTGRAVDWTVIARRGVTVRDAHRSLLPEMTGDAAKPDVIVLVLGGNDLLRLRSGRSWYTNLRALVTALWEITPDAQLLIAGLPPVYLSPVLSAPFGWLVGRRAQAFDQQSVRLARETGAAVETISHRDPLITPAFFAEDRFHPSPHAYQAWSHYLAAGIAGTGETRLTTPDVGHETGRISRW